jgi:hypothetical protein
LVLMLRLQEMESFCCQLLVQIIVSFGLWKVCRRLEYGSE